MLSRVICVSCGFGITKADIFPAVAAQGAGQILLVSCPLYLKATDPHGGLIEYYTSLPDDQQDRSSIHIG